MIRSSTFYAEAGIDKPDLSILSDEFLNKLAASEKPNLQMELLRRLIAGQIQTLRRTNVVQSRRFSELLEGAINRYQNRALTTAEIIAELVVLAQEMRKSETRASELGLSSAEVAFYDAVVQNDSGVLELGDDVLKEIAQALVRTVRESATIDWNLKESVKPRCGPRSGGYWRGMTTRRTRRTGRSSWSSSKPRYSRTR